MNFRIRVHDFQFLAYAECGKPVSKLGQPNIFNGKQTEFGDFSWHAGIYEYSTKLGTFEQSCGGTLISHKVVISAAHCFEIVDKENRKIYLKDLSTIKIALGKFHRTLNSSDDPLAEIIDVSQNHFRWYSTKEIAFVYQN